MHYAFFTFSGCSLPIAKRLADEGNEVLVGVVSDPKKLNVAGWQGRKESAEEKKRRLSLYDGIIEKEDADQLLRKLKRNDDLFVVVDHNNLCEYGEKLSALGLRGMIPLREDYDREQNRAAAKKFVEKNYEVLELPEAHSLKKVEDGIELVENSDSLWVLKSNGNLGATVVPKTTDCQLNHMEVLGALRTDQKEYEKNGYVLEWKIRDPIEFTPQLTFWNGEPIYSQVEIECKPVGAGDIGPDGGGAINLVVKTELGDPLNELFFPPIVHSLARKHAGLFHFDAGILYDSDDTRFYFTEFAGNRWSWGGVFSELAMATNKNRNASEYFERVAAGKNPLRYNFGATVSLYNLLPDKYHASLEAQDIPVYWRRAADEYLWPFQIKKDESGTIVNVGCGGDTPLAYASGCGDSLSQCISAAYRVVENFSFKEVVYRPQCDFLSREYPTAILNRFEAINGELFNVPGFRKAA